MSARALFIRRLLLAAAAAAALTGVLAGLARVGLQVGWGASYAADHGVLFVAGLFATVIALERAVALGTALAVVVPVSGGATVTALLLRHEAAVPLAVACAAGLVAVNTALVRRRPAMFTWVTGAASVLLLLGNLVWASGRPVSRAVPAWIAFLVLTIVAERLRWSRAASPPSWARHVLPLLCLACASAACAGVLGVTGASRGLGAALAGLAAWQLRFDVAWRARRTPGMSRYIALGVLAAEAWLFAAGLLLVAAPLPPAGPRYDAVLHAIFVGFVLATLFAHAPTMLSSVAGVQVRFTSALHAPVLLLHASLLARLAGDLADDLALRRIGAVGNALALGLFVVVALGTAIARRGPDVAAGPTAPATPAPHR